MENRKVETGIGQAEAAEEQTSLKSQNESGLRSSASPKVEGPKCPKCHNGELSLYHTGRRLVVTCEVGGHYFYPETVADFWQFFAAIKDSALASREAEREHMDMCGKLAECAKRHGLGLGGENYDDLVIAELDRLASDGRVDPGARDALRNLIDAGVTDSDTCVYCTEEVNKHASGCPIADAQEFLKSNPASPWVDVASGMPEPKE